MNKEKVLIPASIVFLGLSIIVHGILGYNSDSRMIPTQAKLSTFSSGNDLLSLSETANFLKLSEDEIKTIIQTEEVEINTNGGSFNGIMFPYITIGNKLLFSKQAIVKWAAESAANKRAYYFDQDKPYMK